MSRVLRRLGAPSRWAASAPPRDPGGRQRGSHPPRRGSEAPQAQRGVPGLWSRPGAAHGQLGSAHAGPFLRGWARPGLAGARRAEEEGGREPRAAEGGGEDPAQPVRTGRALGEETEQRRPGRPALHRPPSEFVRRARGPWGPRGGGRRGGSGRSSKAPGTPPAHGGRPAGGRAEHCGSERAGPGRGLGGEKACGATGKGRSPALAQDPSHRRRPLVREPPGGPRASRGLSAERPGKSGGGPWCCCCGRRRLSHCCWAPFAHPRREVKSVHVPNGKQEGVDLLCPGPKGLRFLYRYGVCVASSGSSW